jgi:SAM-dependent methyltransferase
MYSDDPIKAPLKLLNGTCGLALDVGCGEGQAMKVYQYPVVGIDPNKRSLESAKEHGAVILGVGEYLPIREKSVTAVIMEGLLHHVPDPKACLTEAKRCLSNSGVIVLSETLEENPFVHYSRIIYPYWQGNVVTGRYCAKDLENILESCGFKIVSSEKTGLFAWVIYGVSYHIRFLRNIQDALFEQFLIVESKLHRYLKKYSAHYILMVEPFAPTRAQC